MLPSRPFGCIFSCAIKGQKCRKHLFSLEKNPPLIKAYSLLWKKNGQVVVFSHQRCAMYGLERNIESVKAEHPSHNLIVLHMTQQRIFFTTNRLYLLYIKIYFNKKKDGLYILLNMTECRFLDFFWHFMPPFVHM